MTALSSHLPGRPHRAAPTESLRRNLQAVKQRTAHSATIFLFPGTPMSDPKKDFFVSFNSADRTWADWIAWTLEEAGYQVVYQPWDFRPGGNFVLEMQRAASETRKTVIVLSDNYLKAGYTQPEWAAAFVQDPRGEDRKLIPLRVAPCSPTIPVSRSHARSPSTRRWKTPMTPRMP